MEAGRSPNIELITNAEVTGVAGTAGDFTVTVRRQPRFVESSKCTGCGYCSPYCPVKVPDAYNQNLSHKKAIQILYAQAIPSTYYIDPEACLFINRRECKQCAKVCESGAINFKQQAETASYQVGAVILATGFKDLNPLQLPAYRYKDSPNVVTGVEFERISSASGPYQGRIVRPSDLQKPDRIAFVLCAGSRSTGSGKSYCSSVCCKYSVKDAIVALEHEPDLDITVFFMDMRMHGKGLDQFYERARESGVQFIRSRVSEIRRNIRDENLTITYVREDGVLEADTFNLVVLPTGLEPSIGNFSLAKAAGVELNEHGFFRTNSFAPLSTSREGIFAAGGCIEPVALPDSVIQACGAAACASELLAPARGTRITEKTFPAEIPDGEHLRVGVFVCHCGKNIAGIVDVAEVRKHAAGLPDVVMSMENLYSCSEDAQSIISKTIAGEKLNRVVIAACTPRTHEPLFQETLKEAGLNKCLVEMVNIRDQCSWVHSYEKTEATLKAKDLIHMAVAKARLIRPLDEPEIDVIPRGLVLGGGMSGMTAALSIADQGFECCLIEKTPSLGGAMKGLYYTLAGENPQEHLIKTVQNVMAHELITVYTDARVETIDGFVGNFRTVLTLGQGDAQDKIELHHGALILATGAQALVPEGYLYGKKKNVILQHELERRIGEGEYVPADKDVVVMIQCVESRNEKNPYCSSICCSMAVKNALRIKELNPSAQVYILYRDMTMYGFLEDHYTRARNEGIIFIRYSRHNHPHVTDNGTEISVSVMDRILGREVIIAADLLILSTAIVPARDETSEKMLSVPRSSDGFYLESHVQLKPVDSYVDGIYLCGMAHFPKSVGDSIAQAKAAASKAALLLSKGRVKAEPIVSSCDWGLCIGCTLCAAFCPYGAITMKKDVKGKKAEIITAACKGCGVCASYCPTKAISMGRFTDDQINAQIEAFGLSGKG